MFVILLRLLLHGVKIFALIECKGRSVEGLRIDGVGQVADRDFDRTADLRRVSGRLGAAACLGAATGTAGGVPASGSAGAGTRAAGRAARLDFSELLELKGHGLGDVPVGNRDNKFPDVLCRAGAVTAAGGVAACCSAVAGAVAACCSAAACGVAACCSAAACGVTACRSAIAGAVTACRSAVTRSGVSCSRVKLLNAVAHFVASLEAFRR